MSPTKDGGVSQTALTDPHKDEVKAWVPKVRRILEEEYEAQLDRLGLKRSGHHTPVSKMSLSTEAQATRRRVEALFARDSVVETSPKGGFESVRRELSYTLLNRLVGLKAMEARAVLYLPPPEKPEAPLERTEVLTPVPGQAYSRFVRDFRAAGGSRYKYDEDAEERLLRDTLTAAFRFITRDIGILFDPDHEYASIWPTQGTLTRVIAMINNDLPEDAYRARDFLGWVYQFFRQHENDVLREENKGTPRTSYELGVMNQFYTPGWVVKALVDNTLGRLWLSMHPDSRLAAKRPPPLPGEPPSEPSVADYLVPRTGERIPFRHLDEAGQVQSFKKAREIRLLDPACGTMHFGQYAFTLFHQMYLDEIESAGQPGWPEEPSVQSPRDIPAAILEHNLFGIDIDPRAIQIAALSLLLTAKEAALRHDFSPPDVRIRRTNLVVANAVNLGRERLRHLVEKVKNGNGSTELRERLFTVVWDNLQYVSELGSLVQVREGVSQVLEDWVEVRAREKGLTKLIRRRSDEQMELGTILTDAEKARAHQLELERQVLENEAQELQRELLNAIEAEAARATEDPSDRLFAEDTARGLRLLQVLSQHYDIVVMNPPYGAFIAKVKAFVKAAYPLTSSDIYAAFIERATRLSEPEGYVGALVSRTFVTNKSHERLRTEILLKRNPLLVLLDLGEGILEATVQTAAIVLKGSAR